MLVSASHEEGVLEAEEQEMLHKVFDFAETQVDDVMVPRPDVVALPVSLTPAEAVARVLEHPYTRYPVYEEDLDDVCGVLHLRRLFDAMQNGARDAPDLRGLVRPAYFVPETKKLGNLLGEFQRTNTHLAVVVDEYGSTAGIVTLEDLLEEIVGEIADEFDLPDRSILRLGKDRVRVEGSYPIEEFNERFGRRLPEEDYNSLGGFVFGELGRAAEPGDRVRYDGCTFRVHATDGPRILSVDVELSAPSPRTTRRRRARRRPPPSSPCARTSARSRRPWRGCATAGAPDPVASRARRRVARGRRARARGSRTARRRLRAAAPRAAAPERPGAAARARPPGPARRAARVAAGARRAGAAPVRTTRRRAIADGVVAAALDGLDAAAPAICDPAVGGGAFLLAAARRLAADGVPARLRSPACTASTATRWRSTSPTPRSACSR